MPQPGVVDSGGLKCLKPINGCAIACSSVLLGQALAEAFVGVGCDEMLGALARNSSQVLAVSLAVTRCDGRARSCARAQRFGNSF